MSEPGVSPHWFRVAGLRPRLRAHVRIHRHRYRGEVWYVLQDLTASGQFRLDRATREFVDMMDGERTVQAILDRTQELLGEDAPTQDDITRLLATLHAADLLHCDVQPDVEEIFEGYGEKRRARWARRLTSPFSVRFPLFDPDSRLRSWIPTARRLFGSAVAIVWVALLGIALATAVIYWPEITGGLSERVLNPRSMMLMLLTYPLLKTVHELAHALAIKARGGEVHEMGIMFLVFMPVPYVEASAASAFPDKGDRIVVAAAGIMAELAAAAVALLLWFNLEPGLARDLAYNVMLIGSVSTVLFNGNPLLRFDGYYVLCDALEIPNLAGRSTRYLGYLARRYLYGVETAESPVTAAGERRWFFGYGVASGVYRLALTLSIAFFVAGKYPVVGLMLAAWAIIGQLLIPALRYLHFVAFGPDLANHHLRAVTVVGGIVLLIGVALTLPSVPSWTNAQGVVWPPDEAQLRVATSGFVRSAAAHDGALVHKGEVILELEDPLLELRIETLEWKLRELNARRDPLRRSDPVGAALIEEEIGRVAAELEQRRERHSALVVRSPRTGTLVAAGPENLLGRWLDQGEMLGFVADRAAPSARVVVPQDDVGLVRQRTEQVRVKIADRSAETLDARVEREVPAASRELPSKALGVLGGGQIDVNVHDQHGLATTSPVFHFDIALSGAATEPRVGTRVYVRFDHGSEPLAQQWARILRQAFLSRLEM